MYVNEDNVLLDPVLALWMRILADCGHMVCYCIY